MAIVEVKHISKSFQGKQILKSVSFSVSEGSIYGFVGKNGAGKTTTMKMILGLETLSQGEIRVVGQQVRFGETATNQDTGYLPDVPEFYPYMTAKEYLMLCADITGLEKTQRKKRVKQMLKLVNLQNVSSKIGGFSRGMKQRLGIAQALLNKPKLLICDEPTSALDPVGRREFLDLLYSLRHETTIIFSTHILNDVERICDHIGILDQGQMVISSTISDLKKRYGKKQVQITFEKSEEKEQFLRNWGRKCIQEKQSTVIITLESSEFNAKDIFELLQTLKIVPLDFTQREPSLEEIYLEVIE